MIKEATKTLTTNQVRDQLLMLAKIIESTAEVLRSKTKHQEKLHAKQFQDFAARFYNKYMNLVNEDNKERIENRVDFVFAGLNQMAYIQDKDCIEFMERTQLIALELIERYKTEHEKENRKDLASVDNVGG